MNRQLDLQMKIEEGKQKLEKWLTIDKEWAPFEINDYLESIGWICDDSEYDESTCYLFYCSFLPKYKNYTLTFCWDGYLRTNKICISEVEQTEE